MRFLGVVLSILICRFCWRVVRGVCKDCKLFAVLFWDMSTGETCTWKRWGGGIVGNNMIVECATMENVDQKGENKPKTGYKVRAEPHLTYYNNNQRFG